MRPSTRILTIATLTILFALPLAGCLTTAPKQAAANAPSAATGVAREFWVFNGGLDFNETQVRLPHDMFAPDHIIVNKGDNVTIHFYNTEEDEVHTFTMDAPYALDRQVAAGSSTTISFVASEAGIFAYRCTEHQPTMTGYLVVLG